MVSATQIDQLIELATQKRELAHAPYSGYKVGAAVLASNGDMYAGCNIENAAYTPTAHAEMVAIYTAVADDERKFSALAVVTETDPPAFPCANCRQVMVEFCNDDIEVIAANTKGDYRIKSFGELYPESFGPKNLS